MWLPHAALIPIYWNRACPVRLPLPIIPGVNATAHRFGGFGLSTRVHPWVYDREMYKRRNEVERLFRRLKGFRRIFSRFEKLDVLFLGFISFALILDALR